MCKRLEDRVAIVTGATGYLGKFHCVHLAREGAKVVVTDIVDGQATVDAVEEEGGEAVFVKLDVTSWEEAQAVAEETVKRFGRIDILVNNAAYVVGMNKPWLEFTSEDFDRKLAVDINGSFLCARAVFPTMREQRYGKIINVSSQVVLLAGSSLPHASAKAGVIGLTRSLATGMGEYDINVNCIIVGGFPHPGRLTDEELQRMVIDKQALKRIPDPNDLSRVVVFLASDDSCWITGQAIAVCGGALRTGG